jgi:hypothetical protein
VLSLVFVAKPSKYWDAAAEVATNSPWVVDASRKLAAPPSDAKNASAVFVKSQTAIVFYWNKKKKKNNKKKKNKKSILYFF